MRGKKLLFCLFCLLFVFSALPAFAAGVTLAKDDYVYLGAFKHINTIDTTYPLVEVSGDYDLSATPVLWQVRSMDAVSSPTQAYLFSRYIVAQRWWTALAKVPTPFGQAMAPTAWTTSSDLRVWLNRDFLVDFNDKEKASMSASFATNPSGLAEDKVTLPSVDDMVTGGLMGYTTAASTSDGERTADIKGSGTGKLYWLRSAGSNPIGPRAACVYNSGYVFTYGNQVDNALGVRPASQISLNRIIFKSVFDPSSAAAAGGVSNPFMLYCATEYRAPAIAPRVLSNGLIEVSFDKYAVHAYEDTSSDVALAGKFTVRSGGIDVPIGSADVQSGKVILSPDVAFATTDVVTVSYSAYDANDTDGIGFPETRAVLNGFVAPTPPNPDPDPLTPSSDTTPSSVSTTVGGTKIEAQKQPGGTYLITIPYGTDISNLPVNVTPPAKGTVSPDMPVSHDFTKGPLAFTTTAEDGSKKDYTVKVQVEEQKAPTEKTIFTASVANCEIIVTQNADGALAVKVRIPFASGSNPALLDTIKMIASSLGLTNISYSYVDAQGNETPITTRQAGAKTPYLQIAGTAANTDAIKNGTITSIQYTLKGDATQYVQTFANGGLKISSMPGYPSTPAPAPSTGGSSSGCNAAFGTFALLALAGGMLLRRKR